MRTFIVQLESMSPYSQSRRHQTEKLNDKESHEDYEKRTWRERLHVNEKEYVFIPPLAFKNCLSRVGKFLSMQIPGRNKATYTKHFEAGVMVMDPLVLPIKKKDVPGEWLFVPSDGKRGGTTRVDKCFPFISEWKGDVMFYVLDDIITLEVFEKHLKEAGNFIGIGRFRPEKNGYYGRFSVKSVKETVG